MKVRKNVSEKYLNRQVRNLYQAINTIGNDSDVEGREDDYLAMELREIVKVLVERKKFTKAARIAH